MRMRDELTGGESWVGYFTKMDTGRYRQDLPAGRRRALRAVHCALFSAAAAAMTAMYVLERRVRYIRLPDADGGEIN